MGRWKAPQPGSSPYITPEGFRVLKEELHHLWRELRPEVVRALSAAAAEGDRSENAEYTYRKKQLAGIDRRIRYLSRRLDGIKIVDRLPHDQDKVRFGAWVRLKGEDGAESAYRIVGADETDARRGWISIDSPMATALLGKIAGDRVIVELPDDRRGFEVIEVSYTAKNAPEGPGDISKKDN